MTAPYEPGRTEAAFTRLAHEFSTRLSELTTITHLRLNDASVGLVAPDIASLEETVHGLEEQLEEIKTHIEHDAQALPKLAALRKAFLDQTEHLQFLANNLPTYLPGQPLRSSTLTQTRSLEPPAVDECKQQRESTEEAGFGDENTSDNMMASQPSAAEGAVVRKKRPPAPRRYVTHDELCNASCYMAARTPLDKVNAAVEDAATMAEGVARLLAAARAGGAMPAPDRQRAQMLMVNVQNKEGVKARHFFMEDDMKKATGVLRMDKSGKILMTILRHLGRLQELRLQVDGSLQPVYVVH